MEKEDLLQELSQNSAGGTELAHEGLTVTFFLAGVPTDRLPESRELPLCYRVLSLRVAFPVFTVSPQYEICASLYYFLI
jgi:hypothetical protein